MQQGIIREYEVASELCRENKRLGIFFDTWIPQAKFVELRSSEEGIAIIREDNGHFGFGFGKNPPLPDLSINLSLERGANQIEELGERRRQDWGTFYLEPASNNLALEDSKKRGDNEIRNFLESHAPDSSVMPGNAEIIEWITVDDFDELVGVAAICRWESGKFVISSVASHAGKRSQGIGARVMRKTESFAASQGIDLLCLGVLASNASARVLYRKLGWQSLFEFTHIDARSREV